MGSKIKAIFIDHMGTIVTEEGKYAREVIERTYINNNASSLEEITSFWFITSDQLMDWAYG